MRSSDDFFASYPWPHATVRVLVVDDEALGRERLSSLLARRKEVHIVGECANGLEAISAIEKHVPDLVFLDVVMPELDGLEVVEALESERCPQVVFVTGYDQYLQRAFDLHAIGYICKPFTDEKFYDVLEHACQRVHEHLGYVEARRGVVALLADLRHKSHEGQDSLVVHDRHRGIYHMVPTREIDWVEAKNGGVFVHIGKLAHWSRRTLTELEGLLDHRVFLRIHRSTMVNRTRIRAIEPRWKGEYEVTLASGVSLRSGRTYRASIEGLLGWA